jgi:hypothetical protein
MIKISPCSKALSAEHIGPFTDNGDVYGHISEKFLRGT